MTVAELLLLSLLPMLAPAQLATFKVTETAGLRRWLSDAGDVRVRPKRAAVARRRQANSRAVHAARWRQYGYRFQCQLGTPGSRANMWCGPARTSRAQAYRSAGLGAFAIHHSNGLEFDIPDNLLGLLNQVKTPKLSYLRAGSQGLILNSKDDTEYRAGGVNHGGSPTKARIVKQGPLVCAVPWRARKDCAATARSIASSMWSSRARNPVEVTWTVDDTQHSIAGMIADLNLLIEGDPTVVDFGAEHGIPGRMGSCDGQTARHGNRGSELRGSNERQHLTSPPDSLPHSSQF